MTAFKTGVDKVCVVLSKTYDIDYAQAKTAVKSFLRDESISDSISNSEVIEIAETIYADEKYW